MKRLMTVLGAGMVALALAACGGSKQDADPAASGVQYPEWVMKGSGAFAGEAGQVFHGVGVVTGVRNKALAFNTADNRARAEISKTFETYTASLMKDYMASTTAGDMSAVSEEQHVEQAIKTFSANTLSGVVIIDHWINPQDGSIYALAKLDLAAMTDSLDKMKELSSKVRDYVRKNAERVHMDLEKEEAKHEK